MAGAGNKSGRKTSGRDTQDIRQRLDDLEGQLAAARAKRESATRPAPQAQGQALGRALKLATEMIAGVAVGGFIGWALDRWLGSAPLLMVAFLFLGGAAGILNVVRSAKRMQAEAPPTEDLPSVPDDDDDD